MVILWLKIAGVVDGCFLLAVDLYQQSKRNYITNSVRENAHACSLLSTGRDRKKIARKMTRWPLTSTQYLTLTGRSFQSFMSLVFFPVKWLHSIRSRLAKFVYYWNFLPVRNTKTLWGFDTKKFVHLYDECRSGGTDTTLQKLRSSYEENLIWEKVENLS